MPGDLIVGAAERPIFSFVGSVPAFRDMSIGESGIDVQQLQENLRQFGFSTGSDTLGFFGKGTQLAVAGWYKAHGFSTATGQSGIYVPRGEVDFFKSLPGTVVSTYSQLGQAIPASGTVATIGSGMLLVTGSLPSGDAIQTRPRSDGLATSFTTGATLKCRVIGVSKTANFNSTLGLSTNTVTLALESSVPANTLGQEVDIKVDTGSTRTKSWIVPISAIWTTSDGKSFVKIKSHHNAKQVRVIPGLISGSFEAITPSANLQVGDLVKIGQE
jgi:hypothetical protein